MTVITYGASTLAILLSSATVIISVDTVRTCRRTGRLNRRTALVNEATANKRFLQFDDALPNDLVECRDCDTQWVGAGAWEVGFAHMYAADHNIRVTGRI